MIEILLMVLIFVVLMSAYIVSNAFHRLINATKRLDETVSLQANCIKELLRNSQ